MTDKQVHSDTSNFLQSRSHQLAKYLKLVVLKLLYEYHLWYSAPWVFYKRTALWCTLDPGVGLQVGANGTPPITSSASSSWYLDAISFQRVMQKVPLWAQCMRINTDTHMDVCAYRYLVPITHSGFERQSRFISSLLPDLNKYGFWFGWGWYESFIRRHESKKYTFKLLKRKCTSEEKTINRPDFDLLWPLWKNRGNNYIKLVSYYSHHRRGFIFP